MKQVHCAICGKNMTFDNGTEEGMTFIGISMRLNDKAIKNPEFSAFVQKQLGPYEVGRAYEICWECWLRALGVIPEG